MEIKGTEAQKYVWEGAIPLQIHLHESEVTTLPPPPPALILAPRLGYLPLLVPQLKPLFSSIVPPGVDRVWFEYKGLPLRWYIPTGVLFDLLCAEPKRPWDLTVHFRGYPEHVLTPCDGEDSVKWSFINSLKEAACIITGNSKNVMNMSQSDQSELWRSVLNGNLETYLRISSKLKLDFSGDDFSIKLPLHSSKSRQSGDDADKKGTEKPGRIPVRLYVRISNEDFDDMEDAPTVQTWDKVSYINRPPEIHGDDKYTLLDAMKGLLPELFADNKSSTKDGLYMADADEVGERRPSEEATRTFSTEATSCREEGKRDDAIDSTRSNDISERGGCAEMIKLIRIQGIEPKLEIPFGWIVNNLMNPDHFVHISAYVISRNSSES